MRARRSLPQARLLVPSGSTSLILPAQPQGTDRPDARADDADRERAGHSKSHRTKAGLHPGGCEIAEAVHQDIMAYLRTVSLQQVEGPRGFQYLKDDLQERVDLRSEGRVSKVMFRTLVIE